jgi:adenylyltransferase/sulfurtransferase
MRPRTRVRQAEAECPHCREAGRPLVASRIDEGTPLAGRSLAEVGVPPFDVVRIDEEGGGPSFFLLAGDRDGLATGWGLDA